MSVLIKYVAIPADNTAFTDVPICLDGINQEIFDICCRIKEKIEKDGDEFIQFTGLFGSKPEFYYDTRESKLYGDFSGEDGIHSLQMNFALFKQVIEHDLLELRLKTPMYLNKGRDMDENIKPRFKARPATKLECDRVGVRASGLEHMPSKYKICVPEMTVDSIKDNDMDGTEIMLVLPVISIDNKFDSIEEVILHFAHTYKLFPTDGEQIINSEGFIEGFIKHDDYLVYENSMTSIVVNDKYCEEFPPPIAREKDIARIKKYYMEIDSKRVDLPPHSESVFDVNHGHWGLYCFTDIPVNPTPEDFKKIEKQLDGTEFKWYDVSKFQIYAENPANSISHHPVAVDIGTTSTVAAYVDEIMNNIGYLQIGGIATQGEDKEERENHYENPTILMYRNIKEFEDSYRKLPNLPYTKSESIYTAHTAKKYDKDVEDVNLELKRLDKLKQWVNDPRRKVIIQDFEGVRHEFGEFTSFDNKDLTDPVEVYAYFLGLYLNKMHERRIYVKYQLSYTSTFNKPALEKMKESFKRGIKKSLPKGINEDELSVELVLDEATAYAISAIERYRESDSLFTKHSPLPTLEKPLYFGIYDFGGGTLDFSFGKYYLVIDERGGEKKKFEFEHDKTAGSSTLGCEYIIEEAAFDMAYRKRKLLSEHNIRCFKPPQCNEQEANMISAGNSEWSRKNLRMIMDALREKWKNKDADDKDLKSDFKLYNESGNHVVEIGWNRFIKVNDDNNSDHQTTINFEELYFIPKVEEGVALFFKAWSTIKKPEHPKLHVFIGGNAGRSDRVVTALKEKAPRNTAIHKALPTDNDKELIDSGNNKDGYPTAKTGVVYGVLKRGNTTAIPPSDFMYNIGYEIEKGDKLYFGTCKTTTTRDIKGTYQLFRNVPISPTDKFVIRYSTDKKFGIVLEDGEELSAKGSFRKELPLERYANLYLYIKKFIDDKGVEHVDRIQLGVWNTKDVSSVNSIATIGTFNLKTEVFEEIKDASIPRPLNTSTITSQPIPPEPKDEDEEDDLFPIQ